MKIVVVLALDALKTLL